MQALKNRLDRVYKTIIGYEKSIDADSQIFPGDKNPEKMHCLSTVPEYYQLDLFTLQIAQQLPPTTADSLTKSDIGTLEQWGELLLGRSREFDESIEEYRKVVYNSTADRDKIKAYFRLARIYERKKMFHKAEEIYRNIIATGCPEAKVAKDRLDNINK